MLEKPSQCLPPIRVPQVRSLYVCEYFPPGNVLSSDEFAANVKPLVSSAADSSASSGR